MAAETRRISIERILCPIDFSDTSQHALAHAAAMARWYEARLTMLFVFANLPTIDAPALVLEESERARLLDRMRELATIVPPGVAVDCQVQDAGLVHDGILAQVAATKADMLVLGTHGRSGFQRMFLGSVAEKVIRLVKCPTLIVPPRAPNVAPDAPVRFNRILCPIDFSDSSLGALEYAISMAEEGDGQLTLLHVAEVSPALAQEPLVLKNELRRVSEAAVNHACRRLNELIPEEARSYCTVSTAVVEGRAYREILRRAEEMNADLIVMGVHGRGALDLLLFGSTTHHVLRASTCPVVIVRQE
jgi:nucleotide-binding universal stress UspA family protein